MRSAIILCLASDALVTPAAAPYRRVVTVVLFVTATTRRVGSNEEALRTSASAFRVSSRALETRFACTDANASRAARAGRADAGEGRRSAMDRRSGVVAFLGGDRAGGGKKKK